MALEFGFNLYGDDKNMNSLEMFKGLTAQQQGFYHNYLPWYLMFTGIHKVTEASIPHIAKRLVASQLELYIQIQKHLSPENPDMFDLQIYLKDFIGFEANVATLSSADFLKKEMQKMKNQIPVMTAKEAQAI